MQNVPPGPTSWSTILKTKTGNNDDNDDVPFDIALKKPTKKPVIASDSDGESTEESVASLQDTQVGAVDGISERKSLLGNYWPWTRFATECKVTCSFKTW